MKKGLQKILNEFDPRHDFDRFGYFLDYDSYKCKSSIGFLGQNLYFILNGIKHSLRYGLPVGGLGALGFYIAGKNPIEGMSLGLAIIGGLDVFQYIIRGVVIPSTKNLGKMLKEEFTNIKSSIKEPSNGYFPN